MLATQSCQTLCDPMTVAHQAPLSMEFSTQEYWSGLQFPSPGHLPYTGIKPMSPACTVWRIWIIKNASFLCDFCSCFVTEEPEIKLPTSVGSSKKQEFQKNIYFCLLTMPKTLTMWIATNCGKFWKRWEYQTTWPASWEICMQVRKQQLEPYM